MSSDYDNNYDYDDEYDTIGADVYHDLVYIKTALNAKDDHCSEQWNIYGGYKSDILIHNLSKIEAFFLTCVRCKGLLSDPCNSLDSHGEEKVCWNCLNYEEGWFELLNSKEIIESLEIKCPLFERGCVWKGTYSILSRHLEKCEKFLIGCTLKCGKALFRENMEAHKKDECDMRLVSCEFCNYQIIFKKLSIHHDVCPNYPLTCENECRATILRKDMSNHIDTVCPYTIIECPFAEYGCDEENILRCEISQHKKDFMVKHLDMSLIALNKQSNENVTLKRALETAECKLEVLDLKLNHGLSWVIENFSDLAHEGRESAVFAVHEYKFIAKAFLFSNYNLEIKLRIADDNTMDNWPISIRCHVTLLNRAEKTNSIVYSSSEIEFNEFNEFQRVALIPPDDVVTNTSIHNGVRRDNEIVRNDAIVLLIEILFTSEIRGKDDGNNGENTNEDDDDDDDDDEDEDYVSSSIDRSPSENENQEVTDFESSNQDVEVRSKKDRNLSPHIETSDRELIRVSSTFINNQNEYYRRNRDRRSLGEINRDRQSSGEINRASKVFLDTSVRNNRDRTKNKSARKYSISKKNENYIKYEATLNSITNSDEEHFENLRLNDSELEELVDQEVGQEFDNYRNYRFSTRKHSPLLPFLQTVSKMRIHNVVNNKNGAN